MDLPRYDDILMPTLHALLGLGGSGTLDEINDAVAVRLGLDDAALSRAYPKSGTPVVADRCSWARSYLKIAGLLDSGGRGVWLLTDAGRAATGWPDAELRRRVAGAYNLRAQTYRERRRAQDTPEMPGPSGGPAAAPAPDPDARSIADGPDATGSSPGDAAGEGIASADLPWEGRLLRTLRSMSPDGFERLCQRLLRESGFTRVEVKGRSGDGGIDGSGVLRMNLVSFNVLFQAKRWAGAVGASVVRDFRGAMVGRADKGLIITTATFTAQARAEATRNGAPAIDLVDGDDLCRLLKETKIGVAVRLVEQVEIDEAFFTTV